ncbi:hypothetical protein [Thiothrix nivea]|uniref:Uncharacterized protein n=1 Tax=Thiothrix nivea (strain ATCC 35100 / DSM 5205 / JP2) TaxID=870187 RepID=A0A656H9Q7_THINJ|nr:hypothetical protein [Thiothrix nivea]EIJ33358.1 hypothetical protein Thini_0721 [Thiothrix nivea DSM 5205]
MNMTTTTHTATSGGKPAMPALGDIGEFIRLEKPEDTATIIQGDTGTFTVGTC